MVVVAVVVVVVAAAAAAAVVVVVYCCCRCDPGSSRGDVSNDDMSQLSVPSHHAGVPRVRFFNFLFIIGDPIAVYCNDLEGRFR